MQTSAHPLLGKKVTGIGTWSRFLERFEKETDVEVLINLLHWGIDCQEDMRTKVRFYLSIADNHAHWYPWDEICEPVYHGGYRDDPAIEAHTHLSPRKYRPIDLWGHISKKAWNVLCGRVFDKWAHEWLERKWQFDEGDVELVRSFMTFCGRSGNLIEFDNAHHRKAAESFARKFAKEMWDVRDCTVYPVDQGTPREQYKKDLEQIRMNGRVTLAKVLYDIGSVFEVVKLIQHHNHDDRIIPMLQGRAADYVRHEYRIYDEKSLEEMAYYGSAAAQVALLIQSNLAVAKKWNEEWEQRKRA